MSIVVRYVFIFLLRTKVNGAVVGNERFDYCHVDPIKAKGFIEWLKAFNEYVPNSDLLISYDHWNKSKIKSSHDIKTKSRIRKSLQVQLTSKIPKSEGDITRETFFKVILYIYFNFKLF